MTKCEALVKTNIIPLLEKFKLDVERWAFLHLYLWTKSNILEMNVVPSVQLHFLITAFDSPEVLINSVTLVLNGK